MIEVVEKKYFYRDSMRAAIKVALVSMLVNVILAVALIFAVNVKPDRTYFATNLHGGLVKLVPLESPMVSNQGVLSWANEAIVSMYAYDFVHAEEQINKLEPFFTPIGFEEFRRSLTASGVIDTVKTERVVVSAVPQAAPIVEAEGPLRGVYTWRISMPILVAYQGSQTRQDRLKRITLTVQRVSTIDKEAGLAIASVIETSMTK